MKKKIAIQCYATYRCVIEVEAENEDEAIRIAEETSFEKFDVEFIRADSYEPIGDKEKIFALLRAEYFHSDVVSGEFIHSAILSLGFSEEDVRGGVQLFLDWDESDETFEVQEGRLHWIIK